MSPLQYKSGLMKMSEVPLLVGLEFLLVILSILLLFIPSKWFHKKIKELREKRERMNNLDKIVIDKIDNINTNVTTISRKVSKIEMHQRAHRDLSKIPTFECGPDGRVVHVNNALCHMFGVTEDELLGEGWAAYLHEDSKNFPEEWLHQVKNNRIAVGSFKIIQQGTGNVYKITYRAKVERDPDTDEIVYIFGQSEGKRLRNESQ